jgi:leucyl-tRNA synthetase
MKNGILTEPEVFKGQIAGKLREEIIKHLEGNQLAVSHVTYKIHDWLISRQRYWGAPIPIIHCPKDGAVPVPEDQLPVVLPEVKSYAPSGDGRSPLANVPEFVNTTCPKCGSPAQRETDTMDGYACSSWYFLRYLDPHNDKQPWDPAVTNKWMPIDFYNGADHAVSHLLYARFWTHFFHKIGLIDKPEPVARLVYNSYILAPDGSKMSKSKGNVVDPLEVVDSGYGADALRVYEMFIAPYDMEAPWDTRGVPGTYRFLQRTWNLVQEFLESSVGHTDNEDEILRIAHKTIKKVTSDIENVKFNTAVAAMMEAVNAYFKLKEKGGMKQSPAWQFALESLVTILAPFAPHITDELWQQLGHEGTIHKDNWPKHDEKYLVTDEVNIVVQINGKVRANISLAADSNEEQIVQAVKADPKVAEYLKEKEIRKTIYVPKRLINFVV